MRTGLYGVLPERNYGMISSLAVILLGSLALAISAKIQVPFYPVPMTMQTAVVLAIGLAFGWRLGGLTLLAYLAEGAMGLPVFSSHEKFGFGPGYFLGPTGGYLIGFFVAAVVCGFLAERGWNKSIVSAFGAGLIGTAIIFALGALWLGTVIGWDKPVLTIGVAPFILGGIFKSGLVACGVALLSNQLNKKDA